MDDLKKSLPELPDKKKERFIKDYGLNTYEANVLVSEKEISDYYEEVAKLSDKKLGDCARVVLFKCAEVTGGRGMDWNIESFADACERDLGCPRFADLVRAAKSK